LINIPGENLAKVTHYYTEPHPYVNQKTAVIGAGNSACDVALELFYKGADVTMIIRGASISERIKYWIKPNIENRIKEGSIKAYFNSNITRITDTTIEIQSPEGKIILPNDFVLAMTGYRPNFKFISDAGIETAESEERELIYDPHTHESNVKGLYVAGVVCGGMCTNRFFIENASDHGQKIVRHIKAELK